MPEVSYCHCLGINSVLVGTASKLSCLEAVCLDNPVKSLTVNLKF